MRLIYLWLAGLAATVVAVVSAYFWLDRPIALLVHSSIHPAHRSVFIHLSEIPNPIIPCAVLVLIALGFRALSGRPIINHYAAALVCSGSVLFAEVTKNYLKFIFGRTWPETWTQNNPSFIRDGVYGFDFLHAGPAYESFPSGHMTTTCAVLTVLWVWYPRWRGLYLAAAVVIGAGLVGANYHFLSDVIAGSFVGISTGAMATAIWCGFDRNPANPRRGTMRH
jgi:membrane-associated phospholipid phosphatase